MRQYGYWIYGFFLCSMVLYGENHEQNEQAHSVLGEAAVEF